MPSWIRRYRRRTGPSPEAARREKQRASWERMKAQVQAKYQEPTS